MSDYFDALIRASGFAAERPAAVASDPTAVNPALQPVTAAGLEVLDVETVSAPVERVEAPVEATGPPQTPVAPVSVRPEIRNEPVVSTPVDVVAPETDERAGRRPATAPTPPAAQATDTAPAPPSQGPVVSPDNPAIVSSQERIVRAALEWVAADPMRFAVPQAAPESPASATLPPARAPHPAVPESSTDDVQADLAASPLRPLTRPSMEQVNPASRLTADEPPSMVVTPYPKTRVPIEPAAALDRAAPPPTVDARPLPHDEVIEVSIGAIHVRVDAPAPPAAAPAPPAPRAHVPASRPVRDGLRRRALRRI